MQLLAGWESHSVDNEAAAHERLSIAKTCPCSILRIFSEANIENFIGKFLIFLIFLLNTLIVGTR